MVTLFVITAGLVALFVYALATLSGMTPKRLYPLLRVKQEDGRLTSLVTGARRLAGVPYATTPCRCNG